MGNVTRITTNSLFTPKGVQQMLTLARKLDDQAAWRDTQMVWDFGTILSNEDYLDPWNKMHPCGAAGCALGLAKLSLWSALPIDDSDREVAAFFGTEEDIVEVVFWGANPDLYPRLADLGLPKYPITFSQIEPEHVAAMIRAVVAGGAQGQGGAQ